MKGEEKAERLKVLVKRGEESNVRQLSTELGASVRETRIMLAALKGSGHVESVRKNRGHRVRVYYRVPRAAGARCSGETGAARGVPRLHPAAS